MDVFPKNFGFQRIFIQLRHMQLRNLVRKGSAFLLRKIKGRSLSFPSTILVEVTNDCMLNCIMCPHSQLKDKTGYMPFDRFKKIIDECSRHYSLGDLVFSGFGEPLLHPQLIEMSKYAKKKGIPKVRLITNAVLLSRQKTEEILEDSGFDEISLSLDAVTEETYQKIKNSSNFQIVEDNIAHFLKQKKKMNRWKPFVSLHILKMRETVSEISDFLKKWRPLLGEGDHILVKDVHNFAGQVEDSRLEEQIYRGKRFPCRQLWEFLYISWNGDVMPCCMDAFKKLRIGNIRKSSIKELWNTPLLQQIRQIHLQGRYQEIPLCSQCENWWYLGEKPKGR